MSKKGNLDKTIKELRKYAASINEIADNMEKQITNEEPTPTEPVISLEEIRAVLADKSRLGYTAQIRSLLQKYGAEKLSGIDPSKYKALLDDAEDLSNAD